MQEALYWTSSESQKVICTLCPHECHIRDGKAGICRVRVNRGGKLFTLSGDLVAAIHSDPVEKKPFYHFHPGASILSVGTRGCNLACRFCQNHHLSQYEPSPSHHVTPATPEKLVTLALSHDDNIGIAYTYNEPTIFYELMLASARAARREGLKNVAVTNGFISREPLRQLLPEVDAFNVDLKAFNDNFYRQQTGGRLTPVLESLKMIASEGKHLEITMLVIPTLNDSEEEFRSMTNWISTELGSHIPLHLSRYFPAWKLDLPPTSPLLLEHFAGIAAEKLEYVYIGNLQGNRHSTTFCPKCKNEVISRERYHSELVGLLPGGVCRFCGTTISGVF